MINFYRKTRNQPAGRQEKGEDNKPLKYARYAIGEIVLVVIGILIALQINNWNESRKNRVTEIQILNVVYDNLRNDLDDFDKNLMHFSNAKEACKVLLKCAENNCNYQDSLAFHFLYAGIYPHFTPNMSGYELLKSKGLDIVSNDSLKLALTNLYEYGYKYLKTWETERLNYYADTFSPMSRSYIGTVAVDSTFIPNSLDNGYKYLNRFASDKLVLNITNFEAFKTDAEMLGLLSQIKGMSTDLSGIHQKVQNNVIGLTHQLEKELKLKK